MTHGEERGTGYYLSREEEDREVRRAWVAVVLWILAMLLVGSLEGGDLDHVQARAAEVRAEAVASAGG